MHNTATVIPFAQSDVIETFMNGVHPDYTNAVDELIKYIAGSYPLKVRELLEKEEAGSELTERLVRALEEYGADAARDMAQNFQRELKAKNSSPIVNAVTFLPKDELAKLAESLINLTSVKRRMSTDSETVGGPSDVAVITKGDGFIWIKRKHYFKSELNHHYFERSLGGA
ncbi:hypothetical protein [Sansalvadorimonas verongulae]|uniref:hypothetical protein n=1 Tax=Sansalvadorimonas verongulae TaxID=2172824 RepID=UPI0012BC50C7|nr:hypothetical protein [Sansalvadorimonas verongulae]MTI12753.1 hypothetical protein [Sansalvadorimonas verongulae]